MVEYNNEDIRSDIFKGMADATRRSLLTRICQEGPCRVTDLASYYDMSLNAISKHIKVLERSELVTRTTIGRAHWIEANLERILIVEVWLDELKSIWSLRLDRLTKLLEVETSMTNLTVQVSKIIKAPITKVFDAWLDPALLARFILPMPGMDQPQVENDAQNGGVFKIVMQVGDRKISHTGQYIQIDRPMKLVFTWESPESVDDSRVTLDFTQQGDNQTMVKLEHVKFIDEQRRSNHENGWGQILNELEEVMAC